MDRCHFCGTPYKDSSAKFCSHCGKSRSEPFASKINRCTNSHCKNYDAESAPEEHFCSICGSIATFGKIIESMI